MHGHKTSNGGQQLCHPPAAAVFPFSSTGDHKTSEPPRLWQDVSYPHGPLRAHISLCMRRAPLALQLLLPCPTLSSAMRCALPLRAVHGCCAH
eukprot:4853497-Alexandrium_andersonii.AAC.1